MHRRWGSRKPALPATRSPAPPQALTSAAPPEMRTGLRIRRYETKHHQTKGCIRSILYLATKTGIEYDFRQQKTAFADRKGADLTTCVSIISTVP